MDKKKCINCKGIDALPNEDYCLDCIIDTKRNGIIMSLLWESQKQLRELEQHLELIKSSFDGQLTVDEDTADLVYNAVEQSLNLVEVMQEGTGNN